MSNPSYAQDEMSNEDLDQDQNGSNDDDDDDEDDDDEDSLIIKLMDSMFSRKKTV